MANARLARMNTARVRSSEQRSLLRSQQSAFSIMMIDEVGDNMPNQVELAVVCLPMTANAKIHDMIDQIRVARQRDPYLIYFFPLSELSNQWYSCTTIKLLVPNFKKANTAKTPNFKISRFTVSLLSPLRPSLLSHLGIVL